MIVKTNDENWAFDTEENHFFTSAQNVEQVWLSPHKLADLLSWYTKYTREAINAKINCGTEPSA